MNKTQLNRIKALYRDGVSPQICVSNIISMSKSHVEASIFIHKFYDEMIIDGLIEEKAKNLLPDIKKEIKKDESPDG